jgi:hypothetical protein
MAEQRRLSQERNLHRLSESQFRMETPRRKLLVALLVILALSVPLLAGL